MLGLLRDLTCRCISQFRTESRYSRYIGTKGIEIMVSQANFFRDDISGELFPTPAEAIESERDTQEQRAGLLCMAIRHANVVQRDKS